MGETRTVIGRCRLKVHGSVTWRLEKGPDGKGRVAPLPSVKDPTVGDPSAEPMLGVPGPDKRGARHPGLRLPVVADG